MIEIKFKDLNIDSEERMNEIICWCENKFGISKRDRMWRWVGGCWWVDGTYSFKFTNSEDALRFTLKWAI